MTEYLSIKQISENQEEWVLFLNKENLEFVGRYLCLFLNYNKDEKLEFNYRKACDL